MTEQVERQNQRRRESEAELATANRELERKVAARTAELDQANAHLEQAIRQLYDASAELAHSERLVTLGKLVASVSHELNNPLMGALNYVQYVRGKLLEPAPGDGPSDEQRASLSAWLGKAERDIVRASRVTENLLEFGESRDERRGPIAPRELVAGTLKLAIPELHRSGVTANNEVAPGLRDVLGQPEVLRRVLLNLILNAIDALADAQDKRIIIGGRAAKHRIELFVQDSGPGVPEAIRERIFEPFFTTKRKGEAIGLGLSIARRLVEGGGGTLAYEPLGLGGRFVIGLPAFARGHAGGDDELLSTQPESTQLPS